MRPSVFVLVGAIALALCRSEAAERNQSRIVVIAHRANHERCPENSLEAIRAAIAVGANFVELDVRRTRDQHHVLSHDRSLKRMTGVNRNVDDLTLAEIKALQLIQRGGATNPPVTIPTFAEALDVIQLRIGLYLDFKDGDPAEIISQLQRRGQVTNVVVYLPPDATAAWKLLDPALRFIVSLPESSQSAEGVTTFLQKHPGIILDGDVTDYTADLVKRAHEHGTWVWPDIQNPNENPEQWSRALDVGVDGLQTDHPSALIAWLKRIGRR